MVFNISVVSVVISLLSFILFGSSFFSSWWAWPEVCRFYFFKKHALGTSLVMQLLRICLPIQGTQVQSLVQEDPTCHGATKPVRHNYWACTLEPPHHNYWSLRTLGPTCRQLLSPCSATRGTTAIRSLCTATKNSPCSPQLEKVCAQQWRPNSAKKKRNMLLIWLIFFYCFLLFYLLSDLYYFLPSADFRFCLFFF